MGIKTLRTATGFTQKAFGELLNIPKRTIENWEAGVNEPPEYLVKLIEYYLKNENYIKMEDMKMAKTEMKLYKVSYHVGNMPIGDYEYLLASSKADAMKKTSLHPILSALEKPFLRWNCVRA